MSVQLEGMKVDVPPPNNVAAKLPIVSRRLSPTDISQYIRLNRCERFLRLRMYERNAGRQFLYDYDVAPEPLTPLLTKSGADFEAMVQQSIASTYRLVDFAESPIMRNGRRMADNERLVAAVDGLANSETLIIAQPRLQVTLGNEKTGWNIRGDADLIRFDKSDAGGLQVSIVDIKSSTKVSVEHRLQVAFYIAMLRKILAETGAFSWDIGVLYQGPAAPDPDDEALAAQLANAAERYGLDIGYLEVVEDPVAYLAEVEALVSGPASDANRIASAGFDGLFFALGLKCDGCLYNQFCMKDAHEKSDLSLVPYLTPRDKKALLKNGVSNVFDLASLKEFETADSYNMVATVDGAATVQALASTSVGSRIDEIVLRARRLQRVRTLGLRTLPWIPSKGHTTLPYSAPDHNPNLVTIYIDIQHDYVHDRVYLIGALVVANENGMPAGRRSIVKMTDGAPDTAEKEAALFGEWVVELLRTVVELAAPDAEGKRRAPIHLIFWNDFGQRLLLEALGRNMGPMVHAAPALYDFVTQMAAFDSPVATFLDDEIRERQNYPMLCQSLQAVSAFLKFPWDETTSPTPSSKGESQPTNWRDIFRTRLFDSGGSTTVERAGETVEEKYSRRSRHNSQIPVEYAYAAWGILADRLTKAGPDAVEEIAEPTSEPGRDDPFRGFRGVTVEQIKEFQRKRIEAIEWIAGKFEGNRFLEKSTFSLPDLAEFTDVAVNLGQALDEFLTIERHVAVSAWTRGRQLPPERRVLLGETMLVRYLPEDQAPGVPELNTLNRERKALEDQFRAEYKLANPDKKQVRLTPAQKAQCQWSMDNMRFRLRVDLGDVDADIDTVLGLLNIKDGDRLIVTPRWTVDERLPEADRKPFTPTPKQILYGMRVTVNKVEVVKDDAVHTATAFVDVTVNSGGGQSPGYLFASINKPLIDGELYTIDPDINDIYSFWQKKVVEKLRLLDQAGETEKHALYHRVSTRDLSAPGTWPAEAVAAQARFLAGLNAFDAAGLLHDFEKGKRDYIGGHGGDAALLVQGPPGTGKSYSTAFAVYSRLQGALAAHIPQRVLLSCKTHAATNVLLGGLIDARNTLTKLATARPDVWREYFDDRLLTVPLMRFAGDNPPEGAIVLRKDNEREKGDPSCIDDIAEHEYVVVAGTPGGIYGAAKKHWGDDKMFGHDLCQLLILDEASQLSLPEAMMAAIGLSPTGRMIVVGDPRQMPPIIQHAWESEPRRTFHEYQAFASLFETLATLDPPYLRFERSFRLHATMAEFLRDEVYVKDGINYHSLRQGTIAHHPTADAFIDAVLKPEHPLLVILHDETGSQSRNAFEERLIAPLLRALADTSTHALTARDGIGVVVPHRAQRIALRTTFPELRIIDEVTGKVLVEAIDTVERFQGDERDVILISATESDPEYIAASAAFLLDPRRLNVALSRAKKKMILIASQSIFNYFSNDEEMFLKTQIWKNLLRRTCTVELWSGEVDGQSVSVWGNA